jgi:uncharacterized protein YaaR (DUF327 family)
MAKVDFPEGAASFFNPAAYTTARGELKKSREKAAPRGAQKPRFMSLLENTRREAELEPVLPASAETLQGLLDDVHRAGEDLKNRPFPEEIIRYKQAVKNFLNHITENSYALEEHTSGANLLKRKKFTLVQVVDRKLEQLAADILSGQTAQLELLARIDEIKGLLVNLLQ